MWVRVLVSGLNLGRLARIFELLRDAIGGSVLKLLLADGGMRKLWGSFWGLQNGRNLVYVLALFGTLFDI